MLNRLPEYIDPLHLVEKCQGFKGAIALGKMKRLATLLTNTDGEVQLQIQFGRDSAGLAIATGKVTADLHLQCQRCLESMDFAVDSAFTLGVVASLAESGTLPGDYEPLVADQGPISLVEIVEDEILLALPAIAMHDNECTAALASNKRYNAGPLDVPDASEKQNPFAVLAGLKEKLNK